MKRIVMDKSSITEAIDAAQVEFMIFFSRGSVKTLIVYQT